GARYKTGEKRRVSRGCVASGEGAARRGRGSSVGCTERDGAVAHRAVDALASAVRIQLIIGRIRSRYWRTEHLHRDVCQPQAARYDDKDLPHWQRRGCHGRSEGNRRGMDFDYNAKDKLEVSTFKLPSLIVCHP